MNLWKESASAKIGTGLEKRGREGHFRYVLGHEGGGENRPGWLADTR